MISFISCYFLFLVIAEITNSLFISKIVVLLYAVNPAVMAYNNKILTESLALSLTVLYILFYVILIKRNEYSLIVPIIIISIVMTFLRPSFELFYFANVVFGIIMWIFKRDARKTLKKSLIWLLGGISSILLYSGANYHYINIFSISDPVPRQIMAICIQENDIDAMDDIDMANRLLSLRNEGADSFGIAQRLSWEYGNSAVKKQSLACMKAHAKDYIKYYMKTSLSFYTFYPWPGDMRYNNVITGIIKGFSEIYLNLFNLYTFYVINILFLIRMKLMTFKWDTWIMVALIIFSIGIILSSFLLTNTDFPRTMIHILPFEYCMVGVLLNCNGE